MPQESLNIPYLVLIGVVFATIIVSFVIYRAQFEDWQATKAEVATLTTKLSERQKFLQSIDQKSAQLRANAGVEQELSVLLPPEESFEDLLRILDRQGTAAAVFIKKVDNTTANTQSAQRVAQALGKDSTIPDTVTVHGVSIAIQGSYQQIRQFISLTENAIRFMDITALSLSDTKDQPDVLDAVLTANFYSLSAKK